MTLTAFAFGVRVAASDENHVQMALDVFKRNAVNGVAALSDCVEFKLGYIARKCGAGSGAKARAVAEGWAKSPKTRPATWAAADNAARNRLWDLLRKAGLKSPSKQGGARQPKASKATAPEAKATAPEVKATAPEAKATAPEVKAAAPEVKTSQAPTLTIPTIKTAAEWDALLRDMAAFLLAAAQKSPRKPSKAQMAAIRALHPKAE